MSKIGKIDISKLSFPPERHEYETAKFFTRLGYDATFIRPSSIKGTKNPDFLMKNKKWETKSPIVFSKSSFEYNFSKAQKQSAYIIFDLRRLNIIDFQKYLKELTKWNDTTKIKTLLVITKDGKLLDIKGGF